MEESAPDCSFEVINGQVMAKAMGEDEISQGENITLATQGSQVWPRGATEGSHREILILPKNLEIGKYCHSSEN